MHGWVHDAARVSRVLKSLVAASVRAQLQYPADLAVQILFGVLWQTATIAFVVVVISHFSGIGGFSGSAVVLIAGLRMLSHGIYVLLLDNVTHVSDLIEDGRMDGFLVRPLPVLTQVLASEFSFTALGDLAVGLTMCSVGIFMNDSLWTFPHLLYLAIAVGAGAMLEGAFQLMVASGIIRSPVFRGLDVWVDDFLANFASYPTLIFPKVIQGILTFVLPTAFMAYLPAAAVLGLSSETGLPEVVVKGSPALGIAAFLAARVVWKRTLRHFVSVGG